ncbi:MAG: hypothetical protein Ct9H90mP16_15730 [Candidatus Poseidoniales archaeon]|nr:MAG: hypothetical protein Ct9H90mP16_15730 [Candidatus Poseidoniales archaeon]
MVEQKSPTEIGSEFVRVHVQWVSGVWAHIQISLWDKHGEFYFLEVNPRVQVEHTITEMITGVDLVKMGIRVAAGEGFLSNKKKSNSRAFYPMRLNAEDPIKFTPSPGKLWDCHFPGGRGVRVDTHAHIGYEMPGCFDSLLAKLIVGVKTR